MIISTYETNVFLKLFFVTIIHKKTYKTKRNIYSNDKLVQNDVKEIIIFRFKRFKDFHRTPRSMVHCKPKTNTAQTESSSTSEDQVSYLLT